MKSLELWCVIEETEAFLDYLSSLAFDFVGFLFLLILTA